jgi:hypothetical protein
MYLFHTDLAMLKFKFFLDVVLEKTVTLIYKNTRGILQYPISKHLKNLQKWINPLQKSFQMRPKKVSHLH